MKGFEFQVHQGDKLLYDDTGGREVKQDDTETIVLFRAERSGEFKDFVTAVFPCDPADHHGHEMSCFAHIGQHSACTRGWYNTTRPATPAEYADLKEELEAAPYRYRLKVCQRITPAMNETRRKATRWQLSQYGRVYNDVST